MLYPAYSTYKALESGDREKQKDLLSYWTVYGFLSTAEVFVDRILFWFPHYYTAKALLLIWMQHPKTQVGVVWGRRDEPLCRGPRCCTPTL